MYKIVVVGGSGFLGSHVADALSAAGHEITILDHKPSEYLLDSQKMVVSDLLDLNHLIETLKGQDYVFNFAGIADIDEAHVKPVDTCAINVLGNTNLLEAARINDIKRFIFASSIYVYSQFGSFYRASKQSAEYFVEAYQQVYGLDFTILRYGSLYGPRSDHRNGIYRLIHSALNDKRIHYKGDPDAVREYIHVMDAARLSLKILEDDYVNRHLTLSGTQRLAVSDVMKMIQEIVPEDVELHFDDNHLKAHYVMTPYKFKPSFGHKLVDNEFIDLGQGFLDLVDEIYSGKE